MGNELREYRRRHGLTQSDVAEKLHTRLTTVARWERGERRPTGLYARALRELLGQDTEGVTASR